MTFVGKILVIVIMVFALFFLAISTVVYSTATNWKEETKKQREQVTKLKTEVDKANAERDSANKQLQADQETHKTQLKNYDDQIKNLDDQNKQIQQLVTAARKELETSQENAHISLQDADARRKETEGLREQLAAVQKQANEFKLRQTELNDAIRNLERQLQTAKTNNENLRRRVAVLSTALKRSGVNTRPEDEGLTAPPDVEGEVTRVDPRNRQLEISIGSDDGLVVGHELNLFRRQGADAGYLGKIQIDLVEPDRATAHVVGGRTVRGKKIREGDSVATQIRPSS